MTRRLADTLTAATNAHAEVLNIRATAIVEDRDGRPDWECHTTLAGCYTCTPSNEPVQDAERAASATLGG